MFLHLFCVFLGGVYSLDFCPTVTYYYLVVLFSIGNLISSVFFFWNDLCINWIVWPQQGSTYTFCIAVEIMCFVLLYFSVKHTATLYGLFLTRNEAALFWEQDYLVALLFVRSMWTYDSVFLHIQKKHSIRLFKLDFTKRFNLLALVNSLRKLSLT